VRSMKGFLDQTADGKADVAALRAAYEKSLASQELAERIAALGKS